MRRFIALLALLCFCAGNLLAALESPHGPLTLDCQQCHTTAGWKELRTEMEFSHDAQTEYPLVGRHLNLACISCHTSLVFSEAGSECLDCHTDVHRGQFTADCGQCHTPDQWASENKFRKMHETTRMPLVGVHATLDCQSCHATGQLTNLATDCGSCHSAEFASTTDPNHAAAGFSQNCSECHSVTTAGWKNPSFAHPQEFPLTGGHALNDCQACHSAGFSSTSGACFECHATDYMSAANPAHNSAAFPNTCEQCHGTTAWRPATFENHSQTQFPLTGAHVLTDCAQCHVGGQYTGTSTVCVDCHSADYTSAANPTHDGDAFPNTCEQCHTTAGWRPAEFELHDQTLFPLTGAHIMTDCAECHVGGQYTDTPADCWSCHEEDYTGVDDPNHVTNLFPQTCEECHSTANWTETTFDHSMTEFPLTGAHVMTDCAECHIGGVYDGTPTDCWSCHEADYNEQNDHVENSYPQNCAICHNTSDWDEATFNHDNFTFPLTGAHRQTNCTECHIGGVYQGTPTDCWSCHEEDYNDADDHVEENYPHDCTQCHNTTDWDSDFDHGDTEFPLTGAHIQTNCTECHIGGVYDGTPTNCWSCHEEDYNNADDHVGNNYPHDCTQCHNTTNWVSDFDHGNTEFPLTGAHIQTNCAECHIGGVYQGTPTDCWSCHEEDYNDADNHVEDSYPHDCTQCHNTTDWDSGFNHGNTEFPLTGAHVSVNCLACHIGGQFENTPTDCWFCHQDDFNDTSPDHNAGYPQECMECHTTINWSTTFNHDQQHFPIYSGRHDDEWNLCIECHTTPGSFTLFSCIECHEHSNQGNVDDEHNGVSGYTYTPTSCYACHPDGDEGPHRRMGPSRRVAADKNEVQK